MKQLSSYFLLFFFLCSLHAFSLDIKDFDQHFKLLRQPQKIELINGKGIFYNSLQFIFLNGTLSRPVMYVSLNSLPLTNKVGEGVLIMEISNSNNLPGSTEGYILEIKDQQVMLRAKDEAGLFYGCETLLQLLEDAHDQNIAIPACTITDYPDIAYRAIHLDLKHHLDAGHYYYNMIDRLAAIKINAIIVEFEDKLRYRKSPVDGTSDAISATPYGKYLHVGGDEVGNLGMSELAKESGLTPMQLQMNWLNKVCAFAVQHNRIPIFWDDMVFKLSDLYQTTWDSGVAIEQVKNTWKQNEHRLSENINLIPNTCVYMRW